MKDHVDSVAHSCFYQLQQLRPVHRSVPTNTMYTLVHTFITSSIDYTGSLMFSVIRPATTGCSSRRGATITSVWRNDHITSTLQDTLHWLPCLSQNCADDIRFHPWPITCVCTSVISAYRSSLSSFTLRLRGGTAAAAPPPFRPRDPAVCGSCPLVTPY